jgi:hypothetical protein
MADVVRVDARQRQAKELMAAGTLTAPTGLIAAAHEEILNVHKRSSKYLLHIACLIKSIA